MFESRYYFNDQRCLELSIYKINGLKQEATKYHRNDSSYSAKMSMLNYAINTIHSFFNCVKTKFSESLSMTVQLVKTISSVVIPYYLTRGYEN